jgi:exonuclease SbcC
MFLKSIELENIRSYKKSKLDFIKGINFLSGDIGSGKSSILQSIEFSLFGLKGSGIDGKDLLRRGEKKASVKVIFQDKENEIEIYREIKKSSNTTISQGVGYIRINNNLKELTPNELDAKIFELFKFPIDFLKKNKNLIYRFSVYSAQDELKKILQVEPEKRLEIIRKVFNIDKYKNISDALTIYENKLKSDLKYYEGSLEKIDYDEEVFKRIKKEFENKIKEFENLKKEKDNYDNKKKSFQNRKKDLDEKKEKIQKNFEIIQKNLYIINSKKELKLTYEKELNNLNKLIFEFDELNLEKNKLSLENELLEIKEKIKEKNKELLKVKEIKINKELEKEKLNENLNQISRLKNEIELNENLLESIDPLLIECRIEDLKVKLKKILKEIKNIDIKKEEILKEKLYSIKANIDILEKEKLDISNKIETIFDLEKCPHCYQKVEENHKKKN